MPILAPDATDSMASCVNRHDSVRHVSRNGKRDVWGRFGACAGGAAGELGRGNLTGRFSLSVLTGLMLQAALFGAAPARAETTTH